MQFLGALGNTDWYRCESCGLEHYGRRGEVPSCCVVDLPCEFCDESPCVCNELYPLEG
jgi:hypothetical protein